jgi:excisionase family DNA binding protein
MIPLPVEEPLLTLQQVARQLALSDEAVRRAIGRGDLPAVKVCGRFRIARADVDEWLERSRVAPPRQPASRRSTPGRPPSRGVPLIPIGSSFRDWAKHQREKGPGAPRS